MRLKFEVSTLNDVCVGGMFTHLFSNSKFSSFFFYSYGNYNSAPDVKG